MNHLPKWGAAVIAMAMMAPVSADAQSFPRLPRIEKPKMPKIPSVPTMPSIETGQSARGVSGNQIQNFIQDAQKLSVPIDTTSTNDTDNQRIDREVAAYRALADRIGGGQYDAIPRAQREPMLYGLKALYDQAAAASDDEIAHAKGLMSSGGTANAAYNFLIANHTYLYAAQKLFPGERRYASAHAKLSDAIIAIGGSRSAARDNGDAAAVAAARKVRMPSAVTTDKNAEAQFRQAWRTSGIPWKIMKINVTSGWRDKVENGRIIGQRRDAAIAAQNPNDPSRCNLYDFTMFRDRSGNVRRDSHSTTRIACENVK